MLERLINLDHALSVLNKDLAVLFIVSTIFLLIYLLIRTEDKDLVQALGIFPLVSGMCFLMMVGNIAHLPEEIKSVQGGSVEDYYSIYKNGENLEFELAPKTTISKELKLALEDNVTARVISKTKDSYVIEFKNERYTIPVNSIKDK